MPDESNSDVLARLVVYAESQQVIEALRIAVVALGAIIDSEQTSLRQRTITSGGAIEKPNVRIVAGRAIADVQRALEVE